MNDFSEIEIELKKLRPAPIAPGLILRVEEALFRPALPTSGVLVRPRSARANWLSLGLGAGLAAAAGFLMMARMSDDHRTKKETGVATVSQKPNATINERPNERPVIPINSGRMIPTGLTEVVYHTRDEGLQFPEGAVQPVRRLRYHTHETLRWRNPQTGASLRVSYPSEEVVLLPVSGQ
jgi:hypothetical protein